MFSTKENELHETKQHLENKSREIENLKSQDMNPESKDAQIEQIKRK